MSNAAYREKYTARDHAQWQGDWEIIHGDIYAMSPSPSFEHQSINGQIFRQLADQLEECQHCHAVFELDVTLSEDTVIRPDSMVFCYEPEERLTKAPSLVFEVVSPSTAKRDELLKFDLYQQEAVKYYALAYPGIKKVKLYELIDHQYQKVADFTNESYIFNLEKCSIDFNFSKIWCIK